MRKLTESEIVNILSFIKVKVSIPLDCAESIVKITKKRLRQYLEQQVVYPEIIPELKKEIEKQYYASQITPGESVGILAAQAIGEKNTQSSVSYHEEIMIKKNNVIIRTSIGNFINKEMENYYEKGYQGFSDALKANLKRDMDFQTLVQMKHDEETLRREQGLEENEALYQQLADLQDELMNEKDPERAAEIEAKIKALETGLRESKVRSLIAKLIKEELK